jgi:hypothetical protein
VANSILIYGPTGSFKTTQAGYFAKYIYEKTGLVTRMVSTAGGGWAPLNALINGGIIIPWQVSSIANPLPVLRKLAKGYWPRITVIEGMRRLELFMTTAEEWAKIGGYIWEDWTSTSDILLSDLANKQRKIGQEPVGSFEETVIVEGNAVQETFAAPAQSHYNFVQKTIHDLCAGFRSLPVDSVLMTALESKGEEEDTRKTIYGPGIAGKKAGPKSPAWVGDCIHMDDYFVTVPDPAHKPDTDKGESQRMMQITKVRAYFVRHADQATGLHYPAKPRVEPDKFKALLEKYPGGYFNPTLKDGIDEYLKTVDLLSKGASKEFETWKKRIDHDRKAAAK